MKRREEMTLMERAYVPEILRGLAVTNYHFMRNLALNIAHALGLAKDRAAAATTQYPEQRKHYPDHFRGSHRLTLREDNAVRCTACYLCATACPAQCIYIEAGESPDPHVEKYPLRYEIDTLRCIYCGLCVEACPCDAIRMDTYVHPRIWGFDRKDFVETKEQLMHRSTVLKEKGRDGNMQEMLDWYAQQDADVYNAKRPELKRYTERALPLEAEKHPAPEPGELPAIDRHDPRKNPRSTQTAPGGK
ncbi:MAG TPA: NADH-quinone oxidoreductase subunit I [Candidatus Binataceae bacterium]|nr:NADH-quinone oxidoreductase subunit I [Candidatus Binataceae bacterium]